MPHDEAAGDNEPLITRENASDPPHIYDGEASQDGDENELGSIGLFVWLLTVAAGVSGLLFGYDTGVISSTLVSIGSDLSARPLTTLDKSLITSCTSLCALIVSPVTGALADTFGRKRVILIADILFILGALWQARTSSVWGMIGGRSIVGLAVGSASFVVPLYISELAPSRFRGRLVTVSSLFITGGQVVAYVIGWAFSSKEHGWRYMVGLGALPAVIQFVILGFMPETPRWLARVGRRDRAKQVLKKVYGLGQDAIVDAVLKRIEREVTEEDDPTAPKLGHKRWTSKLSTSVSELLSIGANRRALTIACMLQGLQQLCGFNSLMYFSATIFALVGFRSPTLTSLSIATTNFIFTVIAFFAIDRVGRRRVLLYSIPIMTVGLALCSMAFNFITLPDHETSSHDVSQQDTARTWSLIILIAMVVYVAGYAIGLGNVPWQQSELFPLSVRSLGSAFATATNWGSNFIIGLTFLPMMEFLSPVGTFAFYTAICVAGWFCVWRIYPETCGLSLEEVGTLLNTGWGVKGSLQRLRTGRS